MGKDVAAKAVRVSPRTIRRYIERGELEAKPQGEGVNRAWLVSVDSLHTLRFSRPADGDGQTKDRQDEASDAAAATFADVLRGMAARLEQRAAEAAEGVRDAS